LEAKGNRDIEGEAAPFTGSVEVMRATSGRAECADAEAVDRAERCCHRSAQRRGKVFCSPVMNCSKAELIEVIRG
jgi:hypothetical protein